MKDLIFGAVFIVLGISVIILAREFPVIPGMKYGADLFPTLIAIGMIIGGGVLSLNALVRLRQTGVVFHFPANMLRSSMGVLLPGLVVAAYALFSETFGSALIMWGGMLVLLLQQGIRRLPALAISVVATAVIILSFGYLLKVPLPTGPLGF